MPARLLTRLIVTAALTVLCMPSQARADGDFQSKRFTLGDNKGSASFSATISSDNRGVWVDVRGQESISDQPSTAPPSIAPAPLANSAPEAGMTNAAGPADTGAPAGPTI